MRIYIGHLTLILRAISCFHLRASGLVRSTRSCSKRGTSDQLRGHSRDSSPKQTSFFHTGFSPARKSCCSVGRAASGTSPCSQRRPTGHFSCSLVFRARCDARARRKSFDGQALLQCLFPSGTSLDASSHTRHYLPRYAILATHRLRPWLSMSQAKDARRHDGDRPERTQTANRQCPSYRHIHGNSVRSRSARHSSRSAQSSLEGYKNIVGKRWRADTTSSEATNRVQASSRSLSSSQYAPDGPLCGRAVSHRRPGSPSQLQLQPYSRHRHWRWPEQDSLVDQWPGEFILSVIFARSLVLLEPWPNDHSDQRRQATNYCPQQWQRGYHHPVRLFCLL